MDTNLKPVDFKHLNSIVNGDENFKRELIVIFLEQIPVFQKNMRDFFDNNMLQKLAREAHTAKSSVLIFGMINAGRLLKDIQLLAENEKTNEIQTALEQIENELICAKKQLMDSLKTV